MGRLRDECGQAAFEYMLVLGAIVTAVVIGFMAFGGVVGPFVGSVCPSVDTAASPAATAGSCIATVTATP